MLFKLRKIQRSPERLCRLPSRFVNLVGNEYVKNYDLLPFLQNGVKGHIEVMKGQSIQSIGVMA